MCQILNVCRGTNTREHLSYKPYFCRTKLQRFWRQPLPPLSGPLSEEDSPLIDTSQYVYEFVYIHTYTVIFVKKWTWRYSRTSLLSAFSLLFFHKEKKVLPVRRAVAFSQNTNTGSAYILPEFFCNTTFILNFEGRDCLRNFGVLYYNVLTDHSRVFYRLVIFFTIVGAINEF